MPNKHSKKFYSQIDLPFQETRQDHLKEIFKTLEGKFNLQKYSNQVFIDLGSGNGQVGYRFSFLQVWAEVDW